MNANSDTYEFYLINRKNHNKMKLTIVFILYMVAAQGVLAEEVFDSLFLHGSAGNADLSKFFNDNAVLPGEYLVDVYLNNVSVGRENILFTLKKGMKNAEPCIDVNQLNKLGIYIKDFPKVKEEKTPTCTDIISTIPAASILFDASELKLDISIPQISLRYDPQGFVDPSLWDSGVTAGMLNYNYNSFYSSAQQIGMQNNLGLTGGVNIGDWRFRTTSSFDWNSTAHSWQNRELYSQRDIIKLNSQLTLGDYSTSGSLFDTFSLRGLQLATDERMLPDSQAGYAPVVRGIANTNAKVTIRQNGYIIYETTVASGPFEINDLYPSGYGGDLEVAIIEADGEIRTFSVPYSSVVSMLRPGTQRYSVALGLYRDAFHNDEQPIVGQLTYERGLSNLLTGYIGVLAAEDYFSPMVGAAMNTPFGAFGLDLTHASTRFKKYEHVVKKEEHTGQSIRVSYSKSMPRTGSSLSIAAYRYSTSGFYNLQDAMSEMRGTQDGNFASDSDLWSEQLNIKTDKNNYWNLPQRQRSRAQVTFNQSLGSFGSLYITGTTQEYWNGANSKNQFQIGFSSSTKYFNYSVAAMRFSSLNGVDSDSIYATISMPIGSRLNLSSGLVFDKDGNSTRAAINGSLGQNSEYNFGGSFSKERNNDIYADVSGGYKGSHGTVSGSIGMGPNYEQASLGVTGAVVAHAGGITFGQPVGDTFGIIEAPDAAGATLSSLPGVIVNDDGYAILPYLTPYRRNRIDLDPRNTSSNVELKSTSEELIPRSGSVVVAKFDTAMNGRAAIIDFELPKGILIPFGSEVFSDGGNVVGIVGQGGRALLRGLENNGNLFVKWGNLSSQQCLVTYKLKPQKENLKPKKFEYLTAECKIFNKV